MRSGTVAYDPMGVALSACRRHFVAAASFSALLNLLYLAPTIYMLQIYDRVVPTQGRQTLLFLTLALVGALVTLSLLDRVRTRLLVRAGVTLDTMLVPTLMADTLGAGGRAMSPQVLRDFDSLRQTLSGVGIIALFDAPWTPIYVAICFVVHPLLGAVALAGGLTLALLAWRNELATGPELERAQLASADNYAVQDAVFAGSEAVRALGMRNVMVGRMLRQRQTMLTLQTSAALSASNYLALTKFFRLALQSVALGLGALLAIESQISAGAIFAAAFLIARALGPIEQLIGNWRSITRANSIYRGLRASLTVDQPPAPTILPAPKGALAVEGVTVLSPTQDSVIIGDVSVSIAAGEVVAIIGPSGAGKSTLARVIAGAIAPTRGVVRIDGSDMADWDPEKLGRHIGYLPQDISLFGGTVKQNIARFRGEIGASDMTTIDAAVIAATERAHARELIQRLPNGFDYELTTGGRGLSAGQAQRVALARAVFGDPAVIVLDEPNSHLDAEGDTALLAAIDHYKRLGRTVLIVSHKLGVLPIVDKLLVMRAGKVEIFGPRDEVLGRLSGSRPKPTSVVTARG